MKKYDLAEATAVSGAVIIFMLILALNRVYPMAYFWPVLLILLWPVTLLFRARMKKTFFLSIAVWLAVSVVLFMINYLIFRRNDSTVWWCIYPIIGMFFWPLCEVLRLFWRRNK
jgi:predicted neutral ceramidase superfamily lipid hydrolase